MIIFILLFFVAWFSILFWIIKSVIKGQKINKALQTLYDAPTEKNAQRLLSELEMKGLMRSTIFSQNNFSLFNLCRNVFNDSVAPSPDIQPDTKKAVYRALRKCSVVGLNEIA